jgi:pimeloyl-ACP methyl ester carboxylesterase
MSYSLVKAYGGLVFSIIVSALFLLAAKPALATKDYPHEKSISFKNGEQSVAAFEGTIQVKENRSNPNSRLIPLTYVRFPATGKRPGAPIIYLAGGPGGSGISSASYPGFRFPLFMAMREFGDVIALDQRGTGKSKITPRCISSQSIPLDKRLIEEQVMQQYKAAVNECVEFWKAQGADILGYTSIESAKDIDQLRQHLGAEKVTLWGISYGSHLAFASLKVMPDNIDKMVIASAEGLNQTVKLPVRTDAYFARLQRAINSQPKAARAFPNIKQLIQRVHKRLDDSPVMLKLPKDDGKTKDFLFQRHHMQGLTSAMISDPHRHVSRLLQLYSALDHGMFEVLPALVKQAGLDEQAFSFDIMSLAMDIASGITDDRLKLIESQAESSLLGTMLNFPMPQLNRSIEGIDLGDDFRSYPKSAVPTLLLTGTLDGRTYIESQIEATQGLTNLTQVIVQNAGHNLFMVTPEVTQVIQQFMKDEKIKTKHIKFKLPEFIPD